MPDAKSIDVLLAEMSDDLAHHKKILMRAYWTGVVTAFVVASLIVTQTELATGYVVLSGVGAGAIVNSSLVKLLCRD